MLKGQGVSPPTKVFVYFGDQNFELSASLVRNLPAMQATQVQSLGPEGPLDKKMATYSSILTWEIPWTEEPGRLQSTGSQWSDMT